MTAPRLDDDGRCVCCGLEPAFCGKAAEGRQRAAERTEGARLAALPGATRAQFPGRCGDCGEPFEAGAPIQGRARPGHRQPVDLSGPSPWRSLLCCGPVASGR